MTDGIEAIRQQKLVAAPAMETTGPGVVLQTDGTHDPYYVIDPVESATGIR